MKINFLEKLNEWLRKKNLEKMMFPCSDKNCLVRTSCTQGCDKLIYKSHDLRDFFIKNAVCPDCGNDKFYGGPSGGMSQNIKCSGCGHYFNMALPLFVERINLGQNSEFIKSW